MKLFGLIGRSLGHSFSASYFAEKFSREGIDAEYLNFELPDIRELRSLIASHPDLCGLNVTIPYKQAVIPLLDELDDAAAVIGAVNTIIIRRGGNRIWLRGCNTDAPGFRESVKGILPGHTAQSTAPRNRRSLPGRKICPGGYRSKLYLCFPDKGSRQALIRTSRSGKHVRPQANSELYPARYIPPH